MITKQDIGKRVRDGRGHIGILKDVIPDWVDPSMPYHLRQTARPMAFVWSEQSGREWTRPPRQLERV